MKKFSIFSVFQIVYLILVIKSHSHYLTCALINVFQDNAKTNLINPPWEGGREIYGLNASV